MTKTETIKSYFASCPKRFEALLEQEIVSLGGINTKQTVAGVTFDAEPEQVARILMWSRLASRILMPVATEPATTADAIYDVVSQLPWEDWMPSGATLAVDFIGTNRDITNSQFGAQRVKDAIVDRYKAMGKERPNVDRKQPDIRINARLTKQRCVISLDMSGESLHRRGYRSAQGDAPLKENLAAAILIRAGWPEMLQVARQTGEPVALIDPMCGSGTFIIEAAMMAGNVAPGSLRPAFGAEQFAFADPQIWVKVRQQAREQQLGAEVIQSISFAGFDNDARAVRTARQNLSKAGLPASVMLEVRDLTDFANPFPEIKKGLVICNPPYGERLGEVESLRQDYLNLAKITKSALPGWTLAVLTSNRELAGEMRLRAKHKYKFFNGALEAELHCFDLLGEAATLREDRDLSKQPLSEGATMVANRLQKNYRRLQKWRTKQGIESYRLYDADMPEYAAAIDVYENHFHVQEYQAPKSVAPDKADKRLREVVHALVNAMAADENKIVIKTRARQKGKSQYEKHRDFETTERKIISEGRARYYVDLEGYLDTGVFLDHRPLRRMLFEQAAGKRFLNLFCYTATATVQAALGGASETVSVDLSNTYLNWAEDNFNLNNISTKRHQLVRSDCLAWLRDCREGFDLIMLDPPTFSNSKNTDTVLDIQRDHETMVRRCMEILKPGGTLYFSNNLRSFKLDESLATDFDVKDITKQTLDPDFERNTKIHNCWCIQARK